MKDQPDHIHENEEKTFTLKTQFDRHLFFILQCFIEHFYLLLLLNEQKQMKSTLC